MADSIEARLQRLEDLEAIRRLLLDYRRHLDGDTATAHTTWALIRRASGDVPELALLGHYDDVLAREDGRWKFKRRQAHIDIPDHPVA